MAAFPGMAVGLANTGGYPPVTVPACEPHNRKKGVCCAALRELGQARAAAGFSYTDCNNRVRCAKCTVVPSRSKKHPGARVFQYRGARGCGTGCPELGGIQ